MFKKLLIPIFVLLFYVSVHAGMVIGNYYTSVAVDACSSCPSDSDEADVLCEDFDETGALCSWTESVEGTNTYDDDNSHGGTYSCNDKGPYDLLVDWTYGQGNALAYIGTSTESHAYVMVDFRVVSSSLDASSERFALLALSNEGDTCVRVWLTYDGSKLILETYHYDGSSYDTTSGSTEITIGTWYTMTIEWSSGSLVELKLDTVAGGSPSTEVSDSSSIGTRNVNRIYLGAVNAWNDDTEAGDAVSVEFDRLKIDDDTMPSQCGT